MSLENIISKILNDAEEKAANLKKEARRTASLIIKEAQEKAQALSWEILKNTKQKIAIENRRFEVNQAIEYKKAVLDKKQVLIDEAFKKAKEELYDLKDDEYLSLIKAMLLSSVETGDEVIAMSQRDKKRISDSFIKSINSDLEKIGKIGNLKIKLKDNLKNGSFILEGKNTRIDIGFDSILMDLKDEILGEVAEILFTPHL